MPSKSKSGQPRTGDADPVKDGKPATEKKDKGEKIEKIEKAEKTEKIDKTEKAVKKSKKDKAEQKDATEKTEKTAKKEKKDKSQKDKAETTAKDEAEKTQKSDKKDKTEKKQKTGKKDKGKKAKQGAQDDGEASARGDNTSFPSIASTTLWDPTVASLFSNPVLTPAITASFGPTSRSDAEPVVEANADSDVDMEDAASSKHQTPEKPNVNAKRKRKDTTTDDDDLEARHLRKISDLAPSDEEDEEDDRVEDSDDEASDLEIPQHETLTGEAVDDAAKNRRTLFLGNIPISAVGSKKERRSIIAHIETALPDGQKVDSLRFRSTPYASAIPKRASYAKADVLSATSHSTNAYAILTDEAAVPGVVRKLNGTVLLSRHLRVDSVSQPMATSHRRCVFVGNLGYFDDDSAVKEDEARVVSEKMGKPVKPRKRAEPGDSEEGLWRTFGAVGTVESVRVVRDPITRVGKGFAYVQFKNENTVEQALLLNGKAFPPMLPRKLRVTRAKSNVALQRQKGARDGSVRPGNRSKPAVSGSDGRGKRPEKSAGRPANSDRPGRAGAGPATKKQKTASGPGGGVNGGPKSGRVTKKLSGAKLERIKTRTKQWQSKQATT